MSLITNSHPRSFRLTSSWHLHATLLGVFVAFWAALAIRPLSRQDWLLENLLVIVAVPLLIATRRRFRFSDSAYVCLFAFLILHSIGAHYTYALVPYDAWSQDMFGRSLNDILGWERNHYDRVVHFIYGALIVVPSRELLQAGTRPRGAWRYTLPVLFIMSHSALYELLEWAAAMVVAPELGEAYLGTQGDAWDAQQDMALAAAGAIFTTLVSISSRK